MQISPHLRKKTEEYYPLPEMLEDLRKGIKHAFGLSLTTIERAGLRRIVQEVYKSRDYHLEVIGWDFLRMQMEIFQPDVEAMHRFMTQYYHLPFDLANYGTRRDGLASTIDETNRQAFEDHLARIQDEEHHFLND
jgi:hypothetical protein